MSLFHQLREVVELPRSRVSRVLEVGPGAGAFSALLRHYDYRVATLDLDLSKQPDVIGSITALPFALGSVDMVCAFEVLQHLPYDRFRDAVRELAASSRRYVYLSLPCRVNSIDFHLNLRLYKRLARFSTKLRFSKILPGMMGDRDVVGGGFHQHYWEVNRRSYPKRRILTDLESVDLRIVKQFHNPVYPVHYFILCEKK